MSANYLMGIDIGGGGGRCLLIEPETREVTITYRPWSHKAAPNYGQWSYDLDLDKIWQTLSETIKSTLIKADIRPEQIAGVSATSMRHGIVLLDEDANPLLARPNTDARAVNQSMKLAGEYGEELYQRSGHWPSPVCLAPVLIWMQENMPDILEAAHRVLSISDWMGYKLTGEYVFEASQAAESLLYDLKSGDWTKDLIADLGLNESIFPPISRSGDRLGLITTASAEQLGLLTGIPVAVGGADTQCGLLGVGAVTNGQLGMIAGTTAPVQMVTQEILLDVQKRLWTSVHVIPGLYVLESNAGNMGNAIEWFAQTLYSELPDPVGALLADAASAPVGAGGIFSTIGASLFNAAEMGLPIDSLILTTTGRKAGNDNRALLARAVVEGVGFSLLENIDQIEQVSGGKVDSIYIGGGLSRSQTFTKIVSQITGAKVNVVSISEATALGAAICAGLGAGVFPNLASGSKALVKYSEIYKSTEDQFKAYQSQFQDWKALRSERAGLDDLAASIFTQSLGESPDDAAELPDEAFRPQIYISADMGETALEAMQEIGDVTYKSYREGTLLVGEELVETLQGYHVFVTEVDVLDAEALQGLPELRVVAACRGNPVNIDIEACTAAGVLVLNTPGRNADAVADLTINFMLMLSRKLQEASGFLRQPGGEAGDMGRMGQAYFNYQGNELWNKTIGIIGAGAIGRKVIKRLLPFEACLLVYDPYIDDESAALLGARKVALEELLRESDIISLHAPVTEETRGMLNAHAFEQMKAGTYLVNTARAALVDDQALIAALENGKLGGAALDVFRVEPPASNDPLLAFPNVIATPHLGGNTVEVGIHQGLIVAGEIKLLLAGKSPQYLLNPDTIEGFTWTGDRKVQKMELDRLSGSPSPKVSDLESTEHREYTESKSQSQALKTGRVQDEVDSPEKGGLLKRFFSRKDVTAERSSTISVDGPSQSNNQQRETMLLILKLFTANIAVDEKMAEASRGKDIIMKFTIKDLDQVFFINFHDGMVTADLGEPPLEPQVRLRMNADILDGMFTGRISGNKAAMTGKLSFSGDTRKAMTFQRFSRDMERLYQAARDQAGDPGDLSQLAMHLESEALPESGVDQAPGSIQRGPAAVIVGDVRDEILQVNNELYARGLITATGGNISARTDDDPNEVWITPSAIFKGDLQANMMVRIDLDGNLVGDNNFSASSERRVHCAIYKARPEICAVIHTHAPQATIMGLTGIKFQPISTEAAFVGDVPVVPFIMPGTDELGAAVATALGNGVAVIMGNHGLVVAGSSPRRAADMTEIVESTAEKILTCKALGIEPELLPDESLAELREIGKMLV